MYRIHNDEEIDFEEDYIPAPQIENKNMSYVLDINDSNVKNVEFHNEPIAIHVSFFDTPALQEFASAFHRAIKNKQPIIPIYIHSFGGEVYSLLGMIDIIKSSNVTVATICTGKCMSAASVLLSAGTKGFRYIGKNSMVMVHDVSSLLFGKSSDLKISYKETERLKNQIFYILDENAGHKHGYFANQLKDIENADLYLTSEEAIQHGIVDHIGMPILNVSVNTEYTLK